MTLHRILLSLSFIVIALSGHSQESAPTTPTSLPEVSVTSSVTGEDARETVPAPLVPWIDWALKEDTSIGSPPAYDSFETRLSLWPSRLQFDANASSAKFSLEVATYAPIWMTLPGDGKVWPVSVTLDGKAIPVVEREGRPAVRLMPGVGVVSCSFNWNELPQQIKLPPQVGLLALTVNGENRTAPTWDGDGTLWLQRQASSEPVDEDFLSLTAHSLLEDGSPLWFETRIELIVAGKSREESLGTALPVGWQLSAIESALPVAIDEAGLVKTQVRAGRWNITLRAFRHDPPDEIAFAAGANPVVPDAALAFQARPSFRQAEIVGMPQIDVTQTQVPDEWRSLPVYRWDTGTSFQLVERVRGPGERGAAAITVQRSLWLDDDGKALTYQDSLSGSIREIRRLDAAEGHQLGSVVSGGEPQLITHNPEGGAPGFEVRSPQLDATATGRLERSQTLNATGLQTNVDRLSATLHLPPGYRLFALLGADYSRGDWLTNW